MNKTEEIELRLTLLITRLRTKDIIDEDDYADLTREIKNE